MIADKLKPYQRSAAERIASERVMLLADQPGLGKTFTSLGALELSGVLTEGSTTLILGPLITCDTAWVPTIQSFMPEVNVIDGFSGSRAARSKRISENYCANKPNIVVTNHDSIGVTKTQKVLVPALHELKLCAVLIDESHMVLPMEYDAPQDATQFWRGLFRVSELLPKSALRLAISGTPDRGKLHYRFGTWRFLLPEWFKPYVCTYEDWLDSNFYTYPILVPVRRNDGSSFDATVTKVGQMLNKKRWLLWDNLLVVRRTKAEVAQDLPPKQYVDMDVEFSLPLAHAYKAFTDEFVDNDDGSKGNALVYSLRAQQFATCEYEMLADNETAKPKPGGLSPKRDWLVDWLTQRNLRVDAAEPANGKVVIASQFSSVLYWLKSELESHGFCADVIAGDVPQAERSRIQKDFQSESSRVNIVLLSSTLGVGIDLDAADDLIFMDIPRSPDIQEQVEDRIHRVSRNHQVTIWRLRSRGTIDVLISAKNDDVFHSTRALLDGVRAVDFERNILERLEE
jgi:superfamily II DNA or RNA helicase